MKGWDEPQGDLSQKWKGSYTHSAAMQTSQRAPWFSTFSDECSWERGMSFKQCTYEVFSVIHSYLEAASWESILRSLKEVVHYVEPHALVTQIIKKLELLYPMVASFDILMRKFYHLQQNKGEML